MLEVQSELTGGNASTTERYVEITIFVTNEIPGFTENHQLVRPHRDDVEYKTHGLSVRTQDGRLFLPWSKVDGIVTRIVTEAPG